MVLVLNCRKVNLRSLIRIVSDYEDLESDMDQIEIHNSEDDFDQDQIQHSEVIEEFFVAQK